MDSTNGRRKRKNIFSQKFSNTLMKSTVTNEDKSSPSEAFPFPNTTPLSQLRNCVWKENVTPDATIKTYLSLNETHVQNKRIQSTNRKPLFELTYCELDQNNGKVARRRRKLIINQKLAEKSNTIATITIQNSVH
ncbi:hypothetical protein DEO72_LG10g1401 [Vigna unguiculata]|uniref:Uncharacterized protein n=1 Tax=Vigna unguiculata TaxID=3917 RepID=A0A4D6NDG2_VIGUN|nr:hypothetical protein DEO72_LG10g1401 [Vigna unguiculata]